MNSVTTIKNALKNGADPKMICATCPWDRFCIEPPSMTEGDIQAEIDKSKTPREGDGKDGALIGGLLTSLMFGGRDTQASICPILANRLRTSDGRRIVDTMRSLMQGWDDTDA